MATSSEPQRRTFREITRGVLEMDTRVTFTQVGWLVEPDKQFVPLDGDHIPMGVVFAPVYVEGPNE